MAPEPSATPAHRRDISPRSSRSAGELNDAVLLGRERRAAVPNPKMKPHGAVTAEVDNRRYQRIASARVPRKPAAFAHGVLPPTGPPYIERLGTGERHQLGRYAGLFRP